MDGSAYLRPHLWERILTEHDLHVKKLRDDRYDMIIHLSTAADGAQDFYKLDGNVARHEDIQFAIELDKKLKEAWIEHNNFYQISNNNHPSFQEKIEETCKTVFKFLGLPTDNSFYNKFLVSN